MVKNSGKSMVPLPAASIYTFCVGWFRGAVQLMKKIGGETMSEIEKNKNDNDSAPLPTPLIQSPIYYTTNSPLESYP